MGRNSAAGARDNLWIYSLDKLCINLWDDLWISGLLVKQSLSPCPMGHLLRLFGYYPQAAASVL